MSNSTNFSALSSCDIDWGKHYLIAYIQIPIAVLGILSNLSGIIVLLLKQKTHESIFHKLIIFLAVWDLSYLTFSLMHLITFFQNPYLSYALNRYAYPIQFTLLTGSIYSTIALTLDRYLLTYDPPDLIQHFDIFILRYIAFCHPFSYHIKKIKSKQYILIILVFSICYNIPQWFALEADFEKFILIDKRNTKLFLVRFLVL